MRKLALLLFAVAIPSWGQGRVNNPPRFLVGTTIVSGLPPAASATNQFWGVTDGATATDCSTGSGTSGVVCWSNGSAWASVGGSGGSGTVTSFSAGTLSPLFTTSVATANTTPALTFTLTAAAANTVFGNFTGGSAAPTFSATPAFAITSLTGTCTACTANTVTSLASPPAIGSTTPSTIVGTTIAAGTGFSFPSVASATIQISGNIFNLAGGGSPNVPILWSNNNFFNGTKDAGIDRKGAGILEINNGSANSNGNLSLTGLYPKGVFVASGQTSATTAQTLITTTATSTYQVNAVVTCDTSVAAATVTLTVAYTDPSSTAQTVTPSAAACTTLGAASSANVTQTIRAKTGTTITVAAAISGSPNYDIAASALQITPN